jgi:hypothetical protein
MHEDDAGASKHVGVIMVYKMLFIYINYIFIININYIFIIIIYKSTIYIYCAFVDLDNKLYKSRLNHCV